MTTIAPELRSKIERRAKRAWKRRREGSTDQVTRVSDVTETSLKYRLPYTPDYYGSERIDVILKADGSLDIDPKTTGLIDVLDNDTIKRLKKHGDLVRAYVLTKADAKAGKTGLFSKGELKIGDTLDLKSAIDLISRAAAVEKVKFDERVFAVELKAEDIENYGYDNNFSASKFTVIDELDQVKDLGFTTGLLDLQTKSDVVALRKKKHLGRVRAYKYTTKDAESPVRTGASEKIKYEVGKRYEVADADTGESSNCHKGINVADVQWCKGYDNNGHRMFAFEFDMKDIAAIPTSTDGKFRLHRCICVDEVDPKTFLPLPPPTPMLPAVIPPTDVPDEPKKKKGIFDRLFGSGDQP